MDQIMRKISMVIKAASLALFVSVAGTGYVSQQISGQEISKVYAAQNISKEKAKSIALKDADAKESQVTSLKVKKDGKNEYEVRFIKGSFRFEYEINAKNGKIKDFERKRISLSSSAKKQDIGKAKAESLALKSAGVSRANASNVKVKIKKTSKKYKYYKVTFHTSAKEYEYEIDLYTGLILEEDIDSLDDDD